MHMYKCKHDQKTYKWKAPPPTPSSEAAAVIRPHCRPSDGGGMLSLASVCAFFLTAVWQFTGRLQSCVCSVWFVQVSCPVAASTERKGTIYFPQGAICPLSHMAAELQAARSRGANFMDHSPGRCSVRRVLSYPLIEIRVTSCTNDNHAHYEWLHAHLCIKFLKCNCW